MIVIMFAVTLENDFGFKASIFLLKVKVKGLEMFSIQNNIYA